MMKMGSRLMTLLLFVLTNDSFCKEDGPPTCNITRSLIKRHCRDKGFRSVPRLNFPKDYSKEELDLDLSKNHFQILPSNAFVDKLSGATLQTLDLSNCHIREIRAAAFTGLESLVDLNLTSNHLVEIPTSALQSFVSHLEKLYLSDNSIEEISANSFPSLSKLRWLLLAFCKIRAIENGAFESLIQLEFLDLRNNSLTRLSPESFSGLEHIRDIHLQMNNDLQLENCELAPSKQEANGTKGRSTISNKFKTVMMNVVANQSKALLVCGCYGGYLDCGMKAERINSTIISSNSSTVNKIVDVPSTSTSSITCGEFTYACEKFNNYTGTYEMKIVPRPKLDFSSPKSGGAFKLTSQGDKIYWYIAFIIFLIF